MARIPRNEELNDCSFVHVLIEGMDKIGDNTDVRIFKDKRNKERYRNTIKKYCEKYGQTLIAYLILDNSCHLIFKMDKIEDLSACIKSINLSYSQVYNKNHKRNGVLFKNRFRSEPLADKIYKFELLPGLDIANPDDYYNKLRLLGLNNILRCILFIHNKPVELKLCDRVENYEFSSCSEYMSNSSPYIDLTCLNTYYNAENNFSVKITKTKFLDDIELQNSITGKHFLDTDENIDMVLNEFIEKYNIQRITNSSGGYYDFESLDKDIIYNISRQLYARTGFSLRDIANRLGINREKLRRIVAEKKQKSLDFVIEEVAEQYNVTTSTIPIGKKTKIIYNFNMLDEENLFNLCKELKLRTACSIEDLSKNLGINIEKLVFILSKGLNKLGQDYTLKDISSSLTISLEELIYYITKNILTTTTDEWDIDSIASNLDMDISTEKFVYIFAKQELKKCPSSKFEDISNLLKISMQDLINYIINYIFEDDLVTLEEKFKEDIDTKKLFVLAIDNLKTFTGCTLEDIANSLEIDFEKFSKILK